MPSLAIVVEKPFVGAKPYFVDTEYDALYSESRVIWDLTQLSSPTFSRGYEFFMDKDLDMHSPSFCGGGRCIKMICNCGKLLSKNPHNNFTRLKGHERARLLNGSCH